MKQTSAVGRDVLVVAGLGAEKVAEFVVASAEPLGGSQALEAPHTSYAAFHASVVLLESIVLEGVGTVYDPAAKC